MGPGRDGLPSGGVTLALHEEFVRTGGTLFRWRSYLPLVFLPVFVVALGDAATAGRSEAWNDGWEMLCLAVSISGLAFRGWAIGRTPHRTSGRNTREQVADSLNTTGPYSLVRHPLYVGNFLIWLGIAMFPQSWGVLAASVLAYVLYYERIMFAEEAFLSDRFGDEFAAWSATTPAVIPRFGGWRPALLPFSWRVVLRREYSGFFAIACVFTFLTMVREYHSEGRLHLDAGWAAFLAFSVVVYVALRRAKQSGLLPLPSA